MGYDVPAGGAVITLQYSQDASGDMNESFENKPWTRHEKPAYLVHLDDAVWKSFSDGMSASTSKLLDGSFTRTIFNIMRLVVALLMLSVILLNFTGTDIGYDVAFELLIAIWIALFAIWIALFAAMFYPARRNKAVDAEIRELVANLGHNQIYAEYWAVDTYTWRCTRPCLARLPGSLFRGVALGPGQGSA